MATLRLLIREKDRTCFNHGKSERELDLRFRALEQTITDTVMWYRDHGWFGTHQDKGVNGQ